MTDAPYYHGTRAALTLGDLIELGHASNYGTRKQAATSWSRPGRRLREMLDHLEKLKEQGVEATQE